MNTPATTPPETSVDEPTTGPGAPPDDEAVVPRPKSGRGVAFLALVIALLALVGSGALGWMEWRASGAVATQSTDESVRQTRQLEDLQRRITGLDATLAGQDDRPDRQAMAAQLAELERRQRTLESAREEGQAFQRETAIWTRNLQAALEGMQARQAGLDARLANLATRSPDGAAQLDLFELGYVLRLAQERLQLFHDVRAADLALAIADRHLESLDQPMYIGLRDEISRARRALAMARQADHAAVYRTIDDLLRALPDLPFRGATAGSGAAGPGWWARILNSLSGLVTVKRDDAVAAMALGLADQEVIRQRVGLQAEAAQLAALRRDQAAYTAAVNRLSATLHEWFEPKSPAVQQALEWARVLQSQAVDPPVPDISGPWVALQAIGPADLPAPTPTAPATQPETSSQPAPAADPAAGSEPVTTSPAPPEPVLSGEENPG